MWGEREGQRETERKREGHREIGDNACACMYTVQLPVRHINAAMSARAKCELTSQVCEVLLKAHVFPSQLQIEEYSSSDPEEIISRF